MNKPSQILELENILNIKIDLVTDGKNLQFTNHVNTFSLNSNGKINSLGIYNSSIPDISILNDYLFLEELILYNCNIKTLSPIKDLKNINSINISENKNKILIHEINEYFYLKKIICRNNYVESIPNLEKQKELAILNINNNQISEIKNLEYLCSLKQLDLNNNQISEIKNLDKLLNITQLDLSINRISEIKNLENLKLLTFLNLGNNQISKIENLGTLTKLAKLLLPNNQISEIKNLDKLLNLTQLDLSINRISEIKNLENLKLLTFLNLGNNQISKIENLGTLTKLAQLLLPNNQISEIKKLEKLSNLRLLYLFFNQITEIKNLENLSNLNVLNLRDNQITEIKNLENLSNLTSLTLANNQITEIKNLENLDKLKTFNIENNLISEIKNLDHLQKLYNLNIGKNKITSIEKLMPILKRNLNISKERYSSNNIYLEYNPIKFPSYKIIHQGSPAIIRYFDQLKKEGEGHINEAKVTFVGEGASGKTSLQLRILDKNAELPKEDNRTRGIVITDWEFKKTKSRKQIAHIWDFGGQDVYFPIHRFFITENSVFVLLASTRYNQHYFDYWIPTISQFGGNSPIILGQTCHQGNTANWNDLGAYFSNPKFNLIKDTDKFYHELNLPTKNKGLLSIRKSIINQIENLPHYKQTIPKSWISAKKLIESLQKKGDIISLESIIKEIQDKLKTHFDSDDEIKDCLRYYHDIGLILWYYKEDSLSMHIIIEPLWAVNAVYRLIDDEKIIKQRGNISKEDIKRLWGLKKYESHTDVLKSLLKVFKIAFPLKDKKQNLIMPCRLDSITNEEKTKFSDENYLELIYEYDFMPKGIVNQLSAELSDYIKNEKTIWKDAVDLIFESSNAQVLEDFFNRQIIIKSSGRDARSLIVLIKKHLDNIHNEYTSMKVKTVIPCNCKKCNNSEDREMFKYTLLIEKLDKDGNAVITCNNSDTRFSIRQILYDTGFEPKSEKSIPLDSIEDSKSKNLNINSNNMEEIKVFVTYSWTDKNGTYDENHQSMVKKFVDELREKWAIEASIDLAMSEANFVKMMYKNLQKNDKVIIILSEGYAKKADDFKGGVGTEYEKIINDISKNENKYILVSFESRKDEIYPYGFQGNDTIVINNGIINDINCQNQEENRLLSKLTGEPIVVLAAKGTNRPIVKKFN